MTCFFIAVLVAGFSLQPAEAQPCFEEYVNNPEVKRLQARGVDTLLFFAPLKLINYREYLNDTFQMVEPPWYIFWRRHDTCHLQKFVTVKSVIGDYGRELTVASNIVRLPYSAAMDFIGSAEFKDHDTRIEPFIYRKHLNGYDYYNKFYHTHPTYSDLFIYTGGRCMSTGFEPLWLQQYDIIERTDSAGDIVQRDTVLENLNYSYNCHSGWKRLYEMAIAETERFDRPELMWFQPVSTVVKNNPGIKKQPARVKRSSRYKRPGKRVLK